jgi:hypothetical protein
MQVMLHYVFHPKDVPLCTIFVRKSILFPSTIHFVFLCFSKYMLSLKVKFSMMICHMKTYVKIIIKYFFDIIYMYITIIVIKL